MRINLRSIEFAKTGKISADLYSSYEIKIKISVNLETNAVFKIVSTAFNNKGYRVDVPVSDTETTIEVMFTHPGEGQDIKLIPLNNSVEGRVCVIKVDVTGKRKDFNNFSIDDNLEKKLTTPCNLSKVSLIYLRSGIQINNFTIGKNVKTGYLQVELERISSAREKIFNELMSGLSNYNSAYYALDFNKITFKEYELLTALKKVESEWSIEQKQKRNKFAFLEECERQKSCPFFLGDNSLIQLTAGTREEDDSKHITEIRIAPQIGYFCKMHPFVTVKECRPDLATEPISVFSECNSDAKFKVYQCYPFIDFNKSISDIDKNKLIEQVIQMLKEFKNKYKTYNIYTIEISSCGFPNVIENLAEKPVSNLVSNIHVYPSDEYAFFFESLAKDKVNIKTTRYDRKKVKFYIEDNPLSAIEGKKQEAAAVLEKTNCIENYSAYPDINILKLSSANKESNPARAEKSFNSIDDYYQCIDRESSSEVTTANATLYRNGKPYSNIEKNNAFSQYVNSLKQKLQTAFLNLVSVCYSQDYSLDFNIDAMSGTFFEKWGMKEYLDNTVFFWKKVFSNIDIFKYRFKSEFASFWGKGEKLFKGIVSISAGGALTHVDDYEKSALNSSYRYYKKKSEGFLDICLYSVLCNDNAIFANRVKKCGIEGELERSFQLEEDEGGEIEYNIRFPGISAEVEHKVPVFKTSVYEKPFVRDYIGGALIEKNMFSRFHFAPWISLQSAYETTYGKLFKAADILKETIFYLYHVQNQVLDSRLWCDKNSVSEVHALERWKISLKYAEFNVNGMLVRDSSTDENSDNALSSENKQWRLFLDGVNRKIITDIPSSPLLKGVYQYLKTCDGDFILEKYEDLMIGQEIFNFVLIIMAITEFLEKKQVKVLSMMNGLELEYKNMIGLSNGEKLKESADSYDEMGKEAKSKFDALCKELDVFGWKNAFNTSEAGDIKNLLSELKIANDIDFGNLEEFCGSISFVSELLESCINSRAYWLTGINRPMKVRPIFEQ